ncbi:MAG: hypothetical protein M5U35_16890 [Roseovarius sp.]|nr:hypothetical protein [Roseovarius sp.]
MRFSLVALLVAILVLPACGGGSMRESRLNPANWFGRSTSVETPTEPGTVRTADGRVEEVNPLIGERRQSKMIQSNRRVHRNSGSIFDRKKTEVYEGTRIDQVTDLDIERTSTGAIVRATGVSSRQGAFDVRLIALGDGKPVDGVLSYEFLALQPINTAVGPEHTRRIQVAQPLSNVQLEEVRTIRVIARHNTRQTSR